MEQDLTTGCWATATPKAELIIIQERVNDMVYHPIGETAPFWLDLTLQDDSAVPCTWTLCKRIGMSCLICEQERSRTLTSKIQNTIWCHQNQLCFVHIFLMLVCCRIATRIRIFYKACDEERLNSKLLLRILRIIYVANNHLTHQL